MACVVSEISSVSECMSGTVYECSVVRCRKANQNVNPKARRCLREESTPATALQRVFEEALAPRAPHPPPVPAETTEQPHKLKPQADWAERVVIIIDCIFQITLSFAMTMDGKH